MYSLAVSMLPNEASPPTSPPRPDGILPDLVSYHLSMSEQPKFDYAQAVQVTTGGHQGCLGAIVGINGPDSARTYTVEFGDGSDSEIAERLLSRYESAG
jgi:hypothetical protein